MPGIKVLIRSSGPIADKSTRRVVTRHLRTAKDELGKELVKRVQRETDRFFVNPTGYYRSQVDYTINQGNGALIVHDRGVIYGPWLEGTSSRNRTTRFKGYAIFRRVAQQTQAEANKVTQRNITTMVKELS